MKFIKRTAVACAAILLVGCGNESISTAQTSTAVSTTEAIITKTTAATLSETTTTPETTTTASETTTTVPEMTTAASETTTTVPETTTTASETTTTVPETTTATSETAATTVETTATSVAATTSAATSVTAALTSSTPAKKDGETIEIDGRKLTLTFSDDFSGTVLDSSKWERVPEWKRQDLNNIWDDDMCYLDGDGRLVVKMAYDENRDAYLSGGVRTKGKFEQAYGYYEIRCRLNQTNGYWTAFWLMYGGSPSLDGNGSTDTEIDIMEFPFYSQNRIFNTIHWDGYGAEHQSVGSNTIVDNVNSGFHTFGLLWDKDGYTFYTDGKQTRHTDGGGGKSCEVPLYIKVTSEYGSWSGGIDNKKLPDYFLVDYVKAYQLDDYLTD